MLVLVTGVFPSRTLAARMGQRALQLDEDRYEVDKVNAVMLKELGLE